MYGLTTWKKVTVFNDYFTLKFRWSIWTGIGWSVCTEIDGQFRLESGGQFDRFFQTYNYYEQLNGYNYLKSLGIGYHFYTGKYTEAILDVLDTDLKTIVHIPNVNSGESTKDKHNEVDFIIDAIGRVLRQDSETGVIYVERHTDKKIIKIADLVEDTPRERDKIVNYLRNISSVDDMDLIIALGMAKEGFDWPYCNMP